MSCEGKIVAGKPHSSQVFEDIVVSWNIRRWGCGNISCVSLFAPQLSAIYSLFMILVAEWAQFSHSNVFSHVSLFAQLSTMYSLLPYWFQSITQLWRNGLSYNWGVALIEINPTWSSNTYYQFCKTKILMKGIRNENNILLNYSKW